MTNLAAQAYAAGAAFLMAALWGCAASLVPFIRVRWRQLGFWIAVFSGVPVLGWLTYVCGPGAGVVGFALGILTLKRSPLLIIRRWRKHAELPRSTAS